MTRPAPMTSTALLTDRYEFTMVDAALRAGTSERLCVFEVFTRSLPPHRRYAVAAGLGRLIRAVEQFVVDEAVLGALDDDDVVSPQTLEWLASYRFRGTMWAYREGELFGAGSPVLTVRGTFADAVLLETLVLSILNYDSAVASAAARMKQAAGDRGVFEFGGRRTHEQAAVAAARAAYVTGFTATSNLQAGYLYDIPTSGTSAHSFTLLHDSEMGAFQTQVAALGEDTILLVDTYDVDEGIEHAIAAGGRQLGGIRIDSGDLGALAHRARQRLDREGMTDTRVVVSGDLDEYRIAELAAAPIDVYGVGTSVVTGSGAPTAGMVYKLVAREGHPNGPLEPVAKGGRGKATVGGAKRAIRQPVLDADGTVVALRDVLLPWDARPTGTSELMASNDVRDLQVLVFHDGELLHDPSLDDIRAHHLAAKSELPPEALALEPGSPGVVVELDPAAFGPHVRTAHRAAADPATTDRTAPSPQAVDPTAPDTLAPRR